MKSAIIHLAMAGIGFAGGALIFGAGKGPASPGSASAGIGSLREWATGQPGKAGASAEKPARDEFERAARSKRGGLGSAMRGHLQLVRETPLGDLPALLLRYERTMPGSEGNTVGALARDAIVTRLLAEDPDALLELALTGRSEHLKITREFVLESLREQQGYAALEKKIAAGKVPVVSMRMMETLLTSEIAANPQRGWRLALENGRVNIERLAQASPGSQVIEQIIVGDSRYRLPDETITQSFEFVSFGDGATAIAKLGEIEQPGERLAAIRGIGGSLGSEGSEMLGAIAAGLASDQERLALYAGSFTIASIDSPWAVGEQRSVGLARVLSIDNEYVRRRLLAVQLRSWKSTKPEGAKAWAEQNGQQDLYERLQLPERRVVLPPISREIPTEYHFTPPGSEDEN